MDKFIRLNGPAASLNRDNIDTDMIIPKQFLKTIARSGLGKSLFEELRYTPDGEERPDFILNQKSYRQAKILIAGDNFGCGSSREHAVWALKEFGILSIIAPNFADIFFNNCFKNGVLPIAMPKEIIAALHEQARKGSNAFFEIDLEAQEIKAPDATYRFDVDPFGRHCLLNGLDDISLTLEHKDSITAYETKRRTSFPWLYDSAAPHTAS